MIAPPPTVRRAAVIDATGQYRYALYRWWCDDSIARRWRSVNSQLVVPDDVPFVLWVMLNPSTADAEIDDPTIRRCLGFTRSWGYEMMAVVNLYARRSSSPKDLKGAFAEGPLNGIWVGQEAANAARIIAAWGAGPFAAKRHIGIRMLLRGEAFCDRVETLGVTKDGQPRHPLYVSGDTCPELFFRTNRGQR